MSARPRLRAVAFWVNRQDLPPEELGAAPEASGGDLRWLLPVLDGWC